MNILIIDDGLGLPKRGGFPARGQEVFAELAAENFRRHLDFGREAAKMGDNVLFIRAVLEPMEEETGIFEFREEDGVSHLIIRVGESRKGARLPLKGYYDFFTLLSSNAAGIAGLFKPEAIICGSVLPFGAFAGAKMARLGGAVLITEMPCSPRELVKRLKLCSPLSPAMPVLKRAVAAAFEKSAAVVGLYPEFFREFTGRKNAVRMFSSAPGEAPAPSGEAKLLKASLDAMAEGNVFTICFCGNVGKNLSLEALVKAAGNFDKKLSVVIIGDGNYKTVLRRLVRENGVTNVTFCDGIPNEDIPFALSSAGAVFVSENTALRGFAAESGGFFPALVAGRPLVAAVEKNADFFTQFGGAVIAPPTESEGIAKAIKTLIETPKAERELMGKRAQSFAGLHFPGPYAKAYRTAIDNFVTQKEF